MGERYMTVQIRIEDLERAEQIAGLLELNYGLGVRFPGDDEIEAKADALLTDDPASSGDGPFVALGRDDDAETAPGPLHAPLAALPANAPAEIVAATLLLAANGYAVSRAPRQEPDAEERPHLSAREMEVLALLAEGAANKVIARRLDISVHTAKFHVASIVTKLSAANRTDAIATAMREGLVAI
ncbi:helix-turn-helix transcriptional regulator [Mesorhizobium xinjiangense]|uniref:helix-turn-helix transcriptional regulator n=1 Tax=Mesorhizobium xinjiangense TaxID=2678685 RepID=UPI0012EDD6CE|nr:LuxR C-terminal-related transcriptional regulator [Mesorhizobium xinjiangense]